MKDFLSLALVGFLLSSCGSPRTLVKVRNNADNTETTISATTGNGGSTSVTVSPKLVVSADSSSINLKK